MNTREALVSIVRDALKFDPIPPDDQLELLQRASKLLKEIVYTDHVFTARAGHGGAFLQAVYWEEDSTNPGIKEPQFTRKWLLSPQMTDSEIVFTAFKCALTSAEHRARENFRWCGEQIMSPHLSIHDLHKLCVEGRAHYGARKAA